MRKCVGFCAEGGGPEEAEMAKSTTSDSEPRKLMCKIETCLHSEHGNLLARSDLCTNEGTPDCKTSTHHRPGIFGLDIVRNWEREILMCANVA